MSKRITAAECAQRAEQVRAKEESIDYLLDYVDNRIKHESNKGLRILTENPLSGIRTPITPSQAEAVWAHYVNQGFTVMRRPGQFSISW